MAEDMEKPQLFGPETADLTIVSWGSNKGAILEALKGLPDTNFLHITWMNPFPADEVKKILGNTTTEVNIGALKNSSGIYEFDLNIGKGTTARKYVSYITKDGKILFTSGIKLSELGKASTQGAQTEQKKLTCNDLDKAETAKLTAYVVSQCPFGLQMQRVFKKAIAELPSLEAQLDIKYIGAVENGKIIRRIYFIPNWF